MPLVVPGLMSEKLEEGSKDQKRQEWMTKLMGKKLTGGSESQTRGDGGSDQLV